MTQISKTQSTALVSSSLPSHIVGIGASAGGLNALEAFFEKVETPSSFAFVVVQHLSSKHKSHMQELMANKTQLKVEYAKDSMPLQANHLYLIPPGKSLEVGKEGFRIRQKETKKRPDFTVDRFFQSLAQTYGENAIAVILSGTGSDGTKGLRFIKDEGGVVLVQTPDSAKFDGMPRNALFTGLVDYELSPDRMFQHIKKLASKNSQITAPTASESDTLFEILKLLKQQTGHDFHRYKFEMILRRIKRRMNLKQIEDLETYTNLLHRKAEEVTLLRQELLVGVTQFFRDSDAFGYVEEHVIPNLFNQAKNRSIRIWIPACSTGEEVYSIAMLIHEYAEQLPHKYQIKIFATDVDEQAVSFASMGQYPESITSDISSERLSRYFASTGSGYRVRKQIRDMIVFTNHNVISNAPFNRLDFISCRNLLIYFQPRLQQRVIALFNFALIPGGYLFLGSNESAKIHGEIFSAESELFKVYRSVFSIKQSSTERYQVGSSKMSPRQIGGNFPTTFAPRQNLKSFILEANNQVLTEEFVTASLVLNQHLDLLRYFGNADRFLQVPNEPSNWNIMKMMNVELAASVSAGVRKALSTNQKVFYPNLHCRVADGSTISINLTVCPSKIVQLDQVLIFVMLQEVEQKTPIDFSSITDSSVKHINERVKDLEQELKITRENLQATIEELQTSNEELLAANEELQGTNEELQSVNEELYTINAEHQATIEQLTHLNNDIDNLLQSGEVGIIFLDEQSANSSLQSGCRYRNQYYPT